MKHMLSNWLRRDETVLFPSQRATHTYVIGQPGTGKSRALEHWAMQDILAGRGVGVIDPHGDLFHHLVARLSSRPSLWRRVIIVDPTDREWTVSINPLHAIHSFSQQRLALFMTDIIVKVWRVEPSSAPRMVWLLTNSFLALAELDLTLLDLQRFLFDRSWREGLLPRITREEVLSYFFLEFPRSEGGVRQWVTPVLNKIGGLLFDPDVRLMLAGDRPLDFRSVLDSRRVLLVNLSKGLLGEGTSALLGAFIVAQIQKAALSRADNLYHRLPFHLYLDEFQNYTTDNIQDVLSESRKYTLSLTLAHQYLGQLSSDLREAVLNTSGTLVSFHVGYQDAFRLAKEIFPSPDALSHTRLRFRQRSLGGLPLITLQTQSEPPGWDGLARKLANLPHRQFFSRRRGAGRAIRQRTLDMPNPIYHREDVAALCEASGGRYGQAKSEVRQQLAAREANLYANFSGSSRYDANPAPVSGAGDRPSIWSE